MIFFNLFLTTLTYINGIIIPCHQEKVLIGLIISSNDIKIALASRSSMQNLTVFHIYYFQPVYMDDVKTLIRDMKNKRIVANPDYGEIPIQMLKENEFTLTNNIDKSINPDSLKEVNINPSCKQDDLLDKSNYKPVSILTLAFYIFTKD